MQYKWEVTVKYTHHPLLLGGEVNKNAVVSDVWWTTIYDNGRRLTSRRVKDLGKAEFLAAKIPHLDINQIRVSGKQPY